MVVTLVTQLPEHPSALKTQAAHGLQMSPAYNGGGNFQSQVCAFTHGRGQV